MSSAAESLSWGSIVREVAVVVIRRPHLFVLLPWVLVTATSTAIWTLTDLGTFHWLTARPEIAGGWFTHAATFLVPLIFGIVATTPLIVLADPPPYGDRRRRPVTPSWAVRRVLENTAISTLIAVPAFAFGPGAIILPMSLLGFAAGQSLLSLWSWS